MIKNLIVVSGGQTGADQGGLVAAKHSKIQTMGYAPKGYRTEKGPEPKLANYNLIQHKNSNYQDRTYDNVMCSDGVIIVHSFGPGSKLTQRICEEHNIPCYLIPDIHAADINGVYTWIIKNNIQFLMIAGARESRSPGIAKLTKDFFMKLFAFEDSNENTNTNS